MLKLSIVVPIYNTEKYLIECIKSVINQSYQNIEIILVNDGSPGNAQEICDEYVKKDSRIKYFSKQNEGVAIARNLGISKATGDYIFCIDSDDTIEIDFVKKIVHIIVETQAELVVPGEYLCKKPVEIVGALPTCAFVIKKSLLDKYPNVRFIEGIQPCEDGLFSHKLLTLTKKIAKCPDAIYNYRQHKDSSEHSFQTQKIIHDIPIWFNILENFYNEYNLWETHKLHLLAFIENEPFSLRFCKMNFSEEEKEQLFNLIHSFINEHDLLKGTIIKSFPIDFQWFLNSTTYKNYKMKLDIFSFLQKFFSVKVSYERKYKRITITILYLKIKIKRFYTNKKLLLIQNQNLIDGQGGVEHVLCNMANVMDNAGFEVTIATMDKKQGAPFYKLNEDIRFYNLYKKMNLFEIIKNKLTKKSFRYKQELLAKTKIWNTFINKQKPNVIVCFSLPTLLEVTYQKKFKTPVILTVHGNPINDYTNRFWPRSDELNKLFESTYQKADVVQVLLDSYQDSVPKSFKGQIITIPNIAPYIDYTIDYNKDNKKIVCIASLDERKHQDLLIKAFSSIADKYDNWSLELWGSGNKKDEYQKLISSLKREDKIFIKGITKNPKEVLKQADIFALPSTCEGWPLVLGEAMSMGIPCVGLKICDGVNEIIDDNRNGLLSEDNVENFAEKLNLLISSLELRKSYGLEAQKDMKNYTEDIVWGKWKELIKSLMIN